MSEIYGFGLFSLCCFKNMMWRKNCKIPQIQLICASFQSIEHLFVVKNMVKTRSMTRKDETDCDNEREKRDEKETAEYFQTLMSENKIKECPKKYGAVISKVSGCRLVMCSICGCKFCFHCKSMTTCLCAGATGHAYYNNVTGNNSD